MSGTEALPSPEDVAGFLQKARQTGRTWEACCPAHDDTNPSLTLSTGNNGLTLWKCRSKKCTQEEVQDALYKLGAWPCPSGGNRSLARPATTQVPTSAASMAPRRIRREHIEINTYTDGAGVPSSSTHRYMDHFADGSTKKAFAQWKYGKDVPDPLPEGYRRHGDWITGPGVLDGVRRFLYDLPAIVANPGGVVYVLEGEKDAENAKRFGLLATTKPEGVVKSATGPDADRWKPVFVEQLGGMHAVLVADNDPPGKQHVEIIASWLYDVCPEVRIVHLPGLLPKGDFTDWMEAGGTREELERIVKATPLYVPVAQGIVTSNPVPAPLRLPARNEVVSRRLGHRVASEMEIYRLRWLWPDWLPLGKLVGIVGNGGLGKSGVSLDIAARLTTGRPMPDEMYGDITDPVGVTVIAHEDEFHDVMGPRLIAAGADMSRIFMLDEDMEETMEDGSVRYARWLVTGDLGVLREHLLETGSKLVIMDPLVAYVGDGKDAHNEQDARSVMRGLKSIATEFDCAFLFVRHIRKAGVAGGDATHAAGGSVAWTNACRAEWAVADDRDDTSGSLRVMSVTKANLARKPASLSFRQVSCVVRVGLDDHETFRVEWLGASEQTAIMGLTSTGSPEERDALRDAVAFLRDCLSIGPVSAKDVNERAHKAGVTNATLRRAKTQIGVESKKIGRLGESSWLWSLPSQGAPEDAQKGEDAHEVVGHTGHENLSIFGSREHLHDAIPDDANADLGLDEAPFRDPPVAQGAQGAQGAQAFHVHTGHETLSALGLDEHLGKPPASVPVASQPALAVTFTGTGGTGPTTRCDIDECYQPVTTASHHGQMLCFRHHPMGTSAPSLPMNIQRQTQ